jgi:putative oxidoreductase
MLISPSVAFLILRVVAGLTLAAHGAQKLFGWFDGPGAANLTQGFKQQGYKPAGLWVLFVILGELGGGLSVALGLLTPLGAAGMFAAMFMAIFKAHWSNGFFNSKRGIEFPLLLLTIGVTIGLAGPGDYALDHLLGLVLPNVWLFGILAFVGLLVDLIGLRISRPAPVAPTQAPSPTP